MQHIYMHRDTEREGRGWRRGGGIKRTCPLKVSSIFAREQKKEKRTEPEVSPDVAQRAPGGGPD